MSVIASELSGALGASMAKAQEFAPQPGDGTQYRNMRSSFMQGWQGGVCDAAHAVAGLLAKRDPDFDRGAFLRACGVT